MLKGALLFLVVGLVAALLGIYDDCRSVIRDCENLRRDFSVHISDDAGSGTVRHARCVDERGRHAP